ncbi:hypothetical protein Hdeb2414_s0006g00215481 [Helianthus debilis subsp. tardiflorus]
MLQLHIIIAVYVWHLYYKSMKCHVIMHFLVCLHISLQTSIFDCKHKLQLQFPRHNGQGSNIFSSDK